MFWTQWRCLSYGGVSPYRGRRGRAPQETRDYSGTGRGGCEDDGEVAVERCTLGVVVMRPGAAISSSTDDRCGQIWQGLGQDGSIQRQASDVRP